MTYVNNMVTVHYEIYIHFSHFEGNNEPVTLVKFSTKRCQTTKIHENFLLTAAF